MREANDNQQIENFQLAGRLNDLNDRRMEEEERGNEREGAEVRMGREIAVARGLVGLDNKMNDGNFFDFCLSREHPL